VRARLEAIGLEAYEGPSIVARPMSRKRIIPVLLLVLVAGCGDDPVEKANIGQVRSVVTRFAEARDASACDLLTGNALVNVYGGFESRPEVAKANCVKKSASFQGEPIKITNAQVIDNVTAKVAALSEDGKFTYSVTVRRPKKAWLIDEINLHKVR
jgi:hypothetical protein